MTPNLKQLEAFVWAVDLGSFSKAASRLNTTQPNISVRIRALETALNVQLLERDAGSVRLTAKGKVLLANAREVLQATDKLISASGDASLREGTLRLGVTELIVHSWLQGFLKSLNEAYPNIHVELTINSSANLTSELFERSIDMAFQNGPFDRPTTGNENLGTYPLTWVASPELGLSHNKKMTLSELSRYPILTHARDSDLYKAISNHFSKQKPQAVRLVPSSNLAACLYMAINHMGVATLPRAMVREALALKQVTELDYNWTPDSLEFTARFDERKSPSYIGEIALLANKISADFGY